MAHHFSEDLTLYHRSSIPMFLDNLLQFQEEELDEDYNFINNNNNNNKFTTNFANSFLMPVTTTATAILKHQISSPSPPPSLSTSSSSLTNIDNNNDINRIIINHNNINNNHHHHHYHHYNNHHHQGIGSRFDEDKKMLSAEYFGSIFDVVNAHTESTAVDVHKSASVFEISTKANSATSIMNASLNATAESSFATDLFYRHSMAMTAVYCVAYLLVFAVGIIGNFFVIAVVFRSPRMRTVTNFFIVNLAVADILVIIFCLPATLMSNIFVRKYSSIHIHLN